MVDGLVLDQKKITAVPVKCIPLTIAWLSPAPSNLLICDTTFKISIASWLEILKAVGKKEID